MFPLVCFSACSKPHLSPIFGLYNQNRSLSSFIITLPSSSPFNSSSQALQSSMASSSPSLTTLEQCFISPPKSTVPETSIPLVFTDIFFLGGGVVERLFFYKFPHPTSHFISDHLPTFKSSLSLTLQHFFPFAGHVRQSPSSSDVYELYYTDGDSVSLTISESTGDFQDLAGDHARDFSKLQPLIPTLAHESEPLMALQVTLFPNQGLCFGIVVSKVVSDGTNSTNFIHSWAATCLSGAGEVSFSTPPSFDRSNIGDPYNLYSIYLQTALYMKEMYKNAGAGAGAGAAKKEEFLATFRLKKEHLEKIKAAIMAGYPEGKAPFHLSTFVGSCAFMWACLVRSKGWPEEKMAYFGFPFDARPRFSPPLPAGFFGGCLAFKSTKAKVGDIVDEVTGVGAAAAAIGKAIDEIKDGAFKGAETMPQMLGEVVANQGVWIAGSPRFKVYDVDFGWGKPVKVEVTTIKGAETMAMAEDGEGGGGGLEFGVSFPKDQIDAFEVCFNGALKALMA